MVHFSLCHTSSPVGAIFYVTVLKLYLFIADIRNSGDHQSAENQSGIFPWVCKRSPGKEVALVTFIKTDLLQHTLVIGTQQ